jgi:hypothetical protein
MMKGAGFLYALIVFLLLSVVVAVIVNEPVVPAHKPTATSLVSGVPYVLAREQEVGLGVERSVAVVGSLTGRVRSFSDDVLLVAYTAKLDGTHLDRISFKVHFIGAEKTLITGRLIDTMTGGDMGSSNPRVGVPTKDERNELLFQFDPKWQLQPGGQAQMKLRLDTTSLPKSANGTRIEIIDSSGKLLARLLYD